MTVRLVVSGSDNSGHVTVRLVVSGSDNSGHETVRLVVHDNREILLRPKMNLSLYLQHTEL